MVPFRKLGVRAEVTRSFSGLPKVLPHLYDFEEQFTIHCCFIVHR